jgi:redox-sensitive bicupin YhaK (pirin superfamily)
MRETHAQAAKAALVGTGNPVILPGMKTFPSLRVRKASERGHANHGWLDSWHTFSFADYYDPAHMGFRSLRVINDDRIAPRGGFPMHPHRDMEIFSYVLSGSLAHEDSMGNRRVLKPGDIQVMRAGSGVRHSEFNPSSTDEGHFLQIWIVPDTRGLAPAYTDWSPAGEQGGKQLVISPDGREGSAAIAQDASVYLLKLRPGESVNHFLAEGRGLWLHVAKGSVTAMGVNLSAGDAVSLEETAGIEIVAGDEAVEALLFDLA